MQLAKTALSLVLCCSLSPLPLLAQQPGAILHSTGDVTVNGHAVSSSSAVFPGDKIESGPNSSASIEANGATAQISPESAVTWQPGSLQFQSGSLTLTAQAPWTVSAGAMSVSLGTELSTVEVLKRQDVLMFKLVRGAATLNESGQTTAMKVNFTVARPSIATTAGAPPAVGHSSHVGVIVLAVGAAAGVGIGLGLRGKGSSTLQPVSPSVP